MKLVCEECCCEADWAATGWQGLLVDVDDDGQDEVVFYCPPCAEREFGWPKRTSKRPWSS